MLKIMYIHIYIQRGFYKIRVFFLSNRAFRGKNKDKRFLYFHFFNFSTVQSIGILTRDFWGEWNFIISLLRRSVEKLKTEFPYPHPLPFGRHLEKRGNFLFSVYLVNGQFSRKNTWYYFCREKYGLHFL